MAYRLGLDLGTNSLGWCAWTLKDDEGQWIPSEILDIGVRVFSDGREPKSGDPLAVERRLARAMRRRRDRQLERRRKVIAALVENGLFPAEPEARRALKALDPYQLRSEGLHRRLEVQELGRVLYHLTVRRGFKSNRKDQKDEKEEGINLQRIRGLWTLIQEQGAKTLGDLLWRFGIMNKLGRPGRRFRAGVESYPDRKMYEDEFKALRQAQEPYHTNVTWDRFSNLMYFQRPLRPMERGRCTFFPKEYRAWKGLPSSQRFRYLQTLVNLKVITDRNESLPLTKEQFERALELFETTAEVSNKALHKKLGLADSSTFNYQTERDPATGQLRDIKFKGNETAVKLSHKDVLGGMFRALSPEDQDRLVSILIEEDDPEKFSKSLSTQFPQLAPAQVEALGKVRIPDGTMAVSSRFIDLCNELMSQRITYHEAAKQIAGHHSDLNSPDQLRKSLPYYGEILRGAVMGAKPELYDKDTNPEGYFGKINNPSVHIALNQLRKLINALIQKHGAPTQIVVEVARELPMGKIQKQELIKEQNQNRKQNEIITRQINEALGSPLDYKRSLNDIRKHKLWVELDPTDPFNRCCLYCGEKISATEAYGAATEIEHILPYSRTLLDGLSNLTVAHKRCNLDKGNRSPFEAFGHSPSGYSWEGILKRTIKLPYQKRNKFFANAMEDFDKEAGFIQRQLNDTRYITRMALQYLGHICPANQIWSANGRLTSDLRYAWGLNSVVGRHDSKERADHRHHAMDALVLGLVDRRTVQLAARKNQGKGAKSLEAPFPFPMPHHLLVERFKGIVTSHKPDHGLNGRFFQETAYGEKQFVEFMPLAELKNSKKDWPRVLSPRIAQALASGKTDLMKPEEQVALRTTRWVSRMALEGVASLKDVDGIVDPLIRQKLRNALTGVEENGAEWKKRLSEFGLATGIRHLRYFPKNQEFVKLPQRGRIKEYKGYQVDDYLCVDVWFVPPHTDKSGKKQRGGYQGQFVTRYQAMVIAKESPGGELAPNKPILPKPHPAARFVCQLFKNDVISLLMADDKNGNAQSATRVFGKIFSYSATQNKIDVRPISTATNILDWFESTNLLLTERGWQPNKSANFLSINVIFGEKGARKEFIPII